jgi:hypothetical protein
MESQRRSVLVPLIVRSRLVAQPASIRRTRAVPWSGQRAVAAVGA